MAKLMNNPADFVQQSMSGILKAHSEVYTCGNGNVQALCLKNKHAGKVAIITGGGYGHLPLFLGYVGEGLCDGAAVGNVFTSPSCETILDVARAADNGAGVLFLFGHYFGDCMNFEMAAQTLADEGINAMVFSAADDIASAPKDEWQERRGIAGIVMLYKIAGAAAAAGMSLEQLYDFVSETAAKISTFGVAFSSCTLPGAGHPIFEIGENELEIGMGIHGEPGIERGEMCESKALAQQMCARLLEDMALTDNKRIALLINGLGATSREELYLFYNDVEQCLTDSGIEVEKSYVGEYVTSMEMSGVSISAIALDDTLKGYLEAKAYAPMLNLL